MAITNAMKFWVLSGLMAVAGLVEATEFLPVDEAFQLTVERQGGDLVLHWDIADHYYLYRDQHRIRPQNGAELGPVQLSPGVVEKYDPTFDQQMAVYYDRMNAVYAVLTDQGEIDVVYQGCADAGLCYPPQTRRFDLNGVALSSPEPGFGGFSSVAEPSLIDLSNPPSPDSTLSSVTLAGALLFALLGGMILNLMPCVFPVLSLKALQLAQHPGDSNQHAIAHGWVYTAGVVVSFILVAVALLTLRSFGTWVGWGFQLQSPAFVAALVALFFVLALAMSGIVEIGGRWMGVGQDLTTQPGLSGSFFTGVLATLVATPCTAPFMGAAIGYALSQPASLSVLIFALMGLGMALPILVLTYLPALGRWLPKPGAWMQTFRQLMAFPLFATVLWLLWVLVELTDPSVIMSAGFGLLLLALVLWSGQWVARWQGMARWISRGVRLIVAVWGLVWVFAAPPSDELWQPYDAAQLERYRANGDAVFIDVTAAWCITCKANERVALSGERFEQLVERTGVRLMRADWTRPTPAVDALIEGFGRNGVPLYALYPADSGAPTLLPQILTPSLVAEAFESL
ncbi:protein-disulfide reductase DsbD family protein [Saccharospirillum mangrovi]|uniref:protein-disulfide reductase DsbD family protein n=1 Tax=Saccharospirillum mangrovi TaxID=2161747 RepID=UPI000D3BBD2A|nr:protein-disulfide reductase DsbD domain-containing protein [Saccharospirillum mangrovi]